MVDYGIVILFFVVYIECNDNFLVKKLVIVVVILYSYVLLNEFRLSWCYFVVVEYKLGLVLYVFVGLLLSFCKYILWFL